MGNWDYDVLVVGSGPGGKHAAIAAAHLGKKVGMIERKPKLGGVSLQSGTIPSKALREAAYLHSRFATKGMRRTLGMHAPVSNSEFLMEAVRTKNTIVDKQEAVLLSQLMRNGVSIIPGEASFHDEHTLEVRSPIGAVDRISAEFIILATGSRPRRPAEIPFDNKRVLDSTSILELSRIPEQLVVVGGGVIACEFATMFALLGVKVSIVDTHEQLLAYLDKDITSLLVEHMEDMGITLYMSTRVKSVRNTGEQVEVLLQDDGLLSCTHLLHAAGRVPNFESLRVEKIGIEAEDAGWIPVNRNLQTRLEHIYVVGDLAGRPSLAATAMEQGRRVILHAYRLPYKDFSSPIPMAIYTIPELSYVGPTERELTREGADYIVGNAGYDESARGHIIGDNRGYLKLLVDRNTRKVLATHIIGEAASELIHLAQLVIGYGGTVDDLANNVYNYPTLAECYKTAALDCVNRL